MAIDRRVARTRTALYDALVALILRKDYDAITVEDILIEANVGRSTFYSHFTSKDELLARSLERLRALLVHVRGRHRDEGRSLDLLSEFSSALFEHVGEFAGVHCALTGGRGGVIVDKSVGNVLDDLLRDWLPVRDRNAAVPRDLAIRHIVATFTTVMHWWLDRNPQVPPAEAEALFKRLVSEGLARDWLQHGFIGRSDVHR